MLRPSCCTCKMAGAASNHLPLQAVSAAYPICVSDRDLFTPFTVAGMPDDGRGKKCHKGIGMQGRELYTEGLCSSLQEGQCEESACHKGKRRSHMSPALASGFGIPLIRRQPPDLCWRSFLKKWRGTMTTLPGIGMHGRSHDRSRHATRIMLCHGHHTSESKRQYVPHAGHCSALKAHGCVRSPCMLRTSCKQQAYQQKTDGTEPQQRDTRCAPQQSPRGIGRCMTALHTASVHT